MKLELVQFAPADVKVAPLAGARIEIGILQKYSRNNQVAPLAGARIEIIAMSVLQCGQVVAPLAGARIEIPKGLAEARKTLSRSPRGSED